MTWKYFVLLLFSLFFLLTSCGGGTSGTALGGGSGKILSGQLLSPNGGLLANAEVTILNSDDRAVTDEAGAFEIYFDPNEENLVLEIDPEIGNASTVELGEVLSNRDLAIVYDAKINQAELLDLSLRSKIVRNCAIFFINTKTIKQLSPLPDNFLCTIEVQFKNSGLPVDNYLFELQHRGCDPNDPWQFSGVSKTGSSGPGIGEIDFNYRNDEKHCVYRIIGPTQVSGVIPLSSQINSLRKQKYDLDKK